MDWEGKLSVSDFEEIGTLNKEHNITLVRHINNGKLAVCKNLSIYNKLVYEYVSTNPIPGIPRILAISEQHECLTIIEEFIEGTALSDIIVNNILASDQIISYTRQLCLICQRLHNANPPIVHRDINPANIVITTRNELYLIDLNIAKIENTASSSDTTYLGTAGFAAPEQYGFGASTTQTDIYGIGAVLNLMLDNCKVPPEYLSQIGKRCVEVSPKDRYNSVDDVLSALDRKRAIPLSESRTWRRFLPPGFRQGKVWHMILALIGYVTWFALSAGVVPRTYSNPYPLVEIVYYKLVMMMIFLVPLFFICNYLGVQRHFFKCSSTNVIVRAVAIIIWSVIIFFVVLFVMLLILVIINTLMTHINRV